MSKYGMKTQGKNLSELRSQRVWDKESFPSPSSFLDFVQLIDGKPAKLGNRDRKEENVAAALREIPTKLDRKSNLI